VDEVVEEYLRYGDLHEDFARVRCPTLSVVPNLNPGWKWQYLNSSRTLRTGSVRWRYGCDIITFFVDDFSGRKAVLMSLGDTRKQLKRA
jgi:hypothetical protein